MRHLFWILAALYVFALLQMSFLVHLFPYGMVPNLIIVLVIGLSLFEKPESYVSLIAAFFGGFLLDVFSGGIIGVWAAILVATSTMIKIVLENYVRFSIPKKF